MSRPDALTATEAADIRQIMALAARGLSDREIARAMGCSLRTVTRRFSAAMTAYGARSRFHLGFVIAAADAAAPAEPDGHEAAGVEQPSGRGDASAGAGSAVASSMPSIWASRVPLATS